MQKINKKNVSEIDLLNIIKIFWEGRFVFISIALIVTLTSAIYGYNQPTLYNFTTKIKKSQEAVFNNYKITNDILLSNNLPLYIDSDTIFEKFTYRANNYTEILSILKDNPTIKLKLSNLDDVSKQRELLNYARAFQLKTLPELEIANASLQWNDTNEGLLIFEQVIKKILDNVKIDVISEIEQSAKVISLIKDTKLRNLKSAGKNILELEKIRLEREILILEEQYSIAKELGIESSFDVEKNIYVYSSGYARGTKAIRIEIDQLKKRSDMETIKRSFEYINISQGIFKIKNDTSTNSLNQSLKFIVGDKSIDWVNFDSLDVRIEKLSTTPKKFLIVGLILGLVLAALYIIISDLIRDLKIKMNK